MESEAPIEMKSDESLKLAKWPQKGAISVQNLDLRSRNGMPLVLKSINFTIGAGMKVGIVGRTGAGKSSIVQALLRLESQTRPLR